MDLALEIAREHGGTPGEARISAPTGRKDVGRIVPSRAGASAFLLAPYLRDTFVACGVLSETFETAITWDRFEEFHATVMETARKAVAEVSSGAPPRVPARPGSAAASPTSTPTAPAPYFTVLAPAVRGGEVEQWDEIKAAVSEALIEAGGTITHHHAVGRDHRPWYDRQRPAPFAAALRAAKAELDPAGMLNPGVLIDPGSLTLRISASSVGRLGHAPEVRSLATLPASTDLLGQAHPVALRSSASQNGNDHLRTTDRAG